MQPATYTGEVGYQTPTVTYTYDQARSTFFNLGALTRVETAVGDTPTTATEFDYDLMGRVRKHRQWIAGQQYDLEYTYNLAGQLTSEKYPSGRVVSMNYDANGRPTTIADVNRTYVAGMQFQGKGNSVSQMSFGNGTAQNYVLNDRLQMVTQDLKRGSEVLQKYDYVYGELDSQSVLRNNGKLESVVSHIATAKQWMQKFTYDHVGRLRQSEERRGDTNALTYRQTFDFDRFGNLYRKQANNGPAGQEHPLPYTPIEETTTPGTGDIEKSINRFRTETAYDDAGNVTTDNKFREMGFMYDANGRMVKATMTNFPDSNSVFNAAGLRVAEKINDVWRFLIYDTGGKLVAEYGGLQAVDEGGVEYVLADWQGSSRAIVNNSGFVNARMDYTVFGENVGLGTGLRAAQQGFGVSESLRQRYGLTERDEATGFDHTWFRKNENKAGRWTSPDPYNGSMSIGNPQSFNRYSYTEGQPTNYIDPTGLQILAPQYECRTVIRFDRPERICEFVGWRLINIGGGPGSSSGGGVGNGSGGGAGSSPSPPPETSCEKVANLLVEMAKSGTRSNSSVEAGRNMIKTAFAYAQMTDGGRNLPTDGFKAGLIGNGQNGHVYRHVFAHAGSMIIGDNKILPIGGVGIGRIEADDTGNSLSAREIDKDFEQLNDPDHRLEAMAELSGDNAGVRVGNILKDAIANKQTDWDKTKKDVKDILCD